MRACLLALFVVLLCSPPAMSEETIGFIEEFALSPDREQTLKQLIPGTQEYFYYHALYYQQTQKFDEVDQLLKQWIEKHGYTDLVQLIRNRQALLTYPGNHQRTLDHLRERTGIQFNHQREILGEKPALPTALDPQQISREVLMKRALSSYTNTDGFEDRALDWLAQQDISADQRRHLLSRMAFPDQANLVDLIVKDLETPRASPFGSLAIHRNLLPAQLDELVKRKPELLNQQAFVEIRLRTLLPNADVDWQNDPQLHRAYLDRQWEFVQTLGPSYNSLKAGVLFHLLQLDLRQGKYVRQRFMQYIRLPRYTAYINPKFMEVAEHKQFPVDLSTDYSAILWHPPISNDEPLVRDYLLHFFEKDNDYTAFAEFISDDYLKQLFAEAKIVNGLGDPQRWAALLTPEQYQQLKDRVDLDFLQTNEQFFAADDPVAIELQVKHVETLIVKVFELNAQNYFRQRMQPLDTDINLDGLVPNEETVHTYDDPAVRRIKRRFEFPEMQQPGVYVVDFIGNGKSSRVLVRKGRLNHLVTTSATGQVFTILDEQNRVVKGASIWLQGREFTSNAEGKILVPFSTAPGRTPIVISHASIHTLDYFQHQGEEYQLTAALFVDRESLLQGELARLVVRAGLDLNGVPTSLSTLEEVTLQIRSTDIEGIESTQTIPKFQLFEDRESVQEFRVPPRLSQITFTLSAKVKKLTSSSAEQNVSQTQTYTINQIDRTLHVGDLHLVNAGNAFYIEVRGRTGEPLADREVRLNLKHRDFKQTVDVSLKSDAKGRVSLGSLTEIQSVKAAGLSGIEKNWQLATAQHAYSSTIHAAVGDEISLPLMIAADQPGTDQLSLLALNAATYSGNLFEKLSIKDGLLIIKGLERGDYLLRLKDSATSIRIRVTQGEKVDDFVLGPYRRLEQRRGQPLQITKLDFAAERVQIQLNRSDRFTRVHIFASRFEPQFAAYDHLAAIRDSEPTWLTFPNARTLYIAGRSIGDEYQYILDRKYARKFPGNMLDRPELLLNPWAVRATNTTTQLAQAGDEFNRSGAKSESGAGKDGRAQGVIESPTDFANLDFLPEGAAVLLNLNANDEGIIEFDRELLRGYQTVTIVAVDSLQTTSRRATLPLIETDTRDLRLVDGLDPKGHFIQQKAITVLPQDATLTIDDIRSSRMETFDSLRDVHRLFRALNADPKLSEFSFVLDWLQKNDAEKRELYSKYACHELNFYVYKKDPEFFRTVVKPYLQNKFDRTFLDRWLLEADLQRELDPWAHSQLNVAERILLGQKTDPGLVNTRRHIQNLYELRPTTRVDVAVYFGQALQSGDLLTDQLDLGLLSNDLSPMRDEGMGGKASGLMAAGPTAEAAPQDAAGKPMNARGLERKSAASEAKKENLQELERAYRAMDADKDGNGFFKSRAGEEVEFLQRQQLYQMLDKTQEWAENNYYHLLIQQQNADLVQVNQFWKDFAQSDPNQPFFSKHFPEATRTFTEMMFALSVLDLPLEDSEQKIEVAENQLKLTAVSPVIVFHEEILPAIDEQGNTAVLVSQNFFREDDRYTFDGPDRLDKFVRDEFLIGMTYGSQIVVTNPTSAPQKVDILIQIPQGAFPVNGAKYTRSISVDLQPYHTHSFEYHFYFPDPGEFKQFPVHVSRDDRVLAFADAAAFHVVAEPSKIDRTSWAFVSQNGSNDDVLTYLEKNNPLRLDLTKIAFRMQDLDFFRSTINRLRQQHVYNHTLWSYAIKHDAADIITEFLLNDNFANQCGMYLESPLLTIDPVVRKFYEHLEYKPLVNARAHQLGRDRKILNDRFAEQYRQLMTIISQQPKMDSETSLAVTYYLLLQDRIEMALQFFKQVSPDGLSSRLQYDYCAAYLDMYSDQPQIASQISERYVDYPVNRWRAVFANIAQQIVEIKGAEVQVVDDQDRNQQQSKLASQAPSFDFRVDNKRVSLNFQNLEQVTVNYYAMDVELLFSRNPFVQQQSGELAFVKPKTSQQIALPKDAAAHSWELPEALHKSNVLVEISGGGQTKSQAYFAHALNVQVIDAFGQLQVASAESGKRAAKVYVKVYARMNDGEVKFYKDGYTDLRGRFDYSSLSTNELDNVNRFALLILSDELGATVREVGVPKR